MTERTDTAKLRELIAAATPGELTVEQYKPGEHRRLVLRSYVNGRRVPLAYAGTGDVIAELSTTQQYHRRHANLHLIAALHNSAPALLTELDTLRAEVERYRKALEKIAEKWHIDRSCSLEAQGYDEVECASIASEDHLAGIARTALTPPAGEGEKAFFKARCVGGCGAFTMTDKQVGQAQIDGVATCGKCGNIATVEKVAFKAESRPTPAKKRKVPNAK